MPTTTLDPAKAHDYFASKMAFTTGPVELDHMIEEGRNIAIIDVRAAEDYEQGHVPKAINIPQEQWDSPKGLRKDAVNILYCYSQTCHLAARAAEKFSTKGYPVMEMDGGFAAWKQSELKVDK